MDPRATVPPHAWQVKIEEPLRLPEALRCLPEKAPREPKISSRRRPSSPADRARPLRRVISPLLEYCSGGAPAPPLGVADGASPSFDDGESFQETEGSEPPDESLGDDSFQESSGRLSPSEPVYLVGGWVPVSGRQRPDSPSSPHFLVKRCPSSGSCDSGASSRDLHARAAGDVAPREASDVDAPASPPGDAPPSPRWRAWSLYDEAPSDDAAAPARAREDAAAAPDPAAASPPRPRRSNLEHWLEARDLGKYAPAIMLLGARKVSDLSHLADDDLDDMGMSCEEKVNIRVTVG